MEEARDGIAWIALYKDGRNWNVSCFWPDISYDGSLVFEPDDLEEFKNILATDPNAILVNGYYCNLGPLDDMTQDSLEAGLRWQYEEHYNLLSNTLISV